MNKRQPLDSQGRTQTDREAMRQRYVNEAILRAKFLGMTLRCQDAERTGNEADHKFCRGESRGGSGCLCRCHDLHAEILAG